MEAEGETSFSSKVVSFITKKRVGLRVREAVPETFRESVEVRQVNSLVEDFVNKMIDQYGASPVAVFLTTSAVTPQTIRGLTNLSPNVGAKIFYLLPETLHLRRLVAEDEYIDTIRIPASLGRFKIGERRSKTFEDYFIDKVAEAMRRPNLSYTVRLGLSISRLIGEREEKEPMSIFFLSALIDKAPAYPLIASEPSPTPAELRFIDTVSMETYEYRHRFVRVLFPPEIVRQALSVESERTLNRGSHIFTAYQLLHMPNFINEEDYVDKVRIILSEPEEYAEV